MAKESHNGLIASDEAMLRQRLAEIEALHAKPAYFGQFERQKIDAVLRKLKLRLEPDNPAQLVEAADAVIALYRDSLDEAVSSMTRVVRDEVAEVLG
jgi:hypothetical protein